MFHQGPLTAKGGGDSLWQRWQLRRQVLRLWELAYEPTPEPVSRRQFQRLQDALAHVHAALAAGQIRFRAPTSPKENTEY